MLVRMLLLLIVGLLPAFSHAEDSVMVRYAFDGSPQKRIFMSIFYGKGMVTVKTKDGDKEDEHMFKLTAEESAQFLKGFEQIEDLRKGKIAEGAPVDSKTHHIFAVLDSARSRDKGETFAVQAATSSPEFKTWLAIIDREKGAPASPAGKP